MAEVDPIRSREMIEDLKDLLRIQNYRDFMLFYIGINVPYRGCDLVKLRVYELRDKMFLRLREMKTGKRNKLFINEKLQQEISFYTKNMGDSDFMFSSRKGKGYIDRDRMYRIVKAAAEKVGVKDRIGAHSLRKTFGYHYYLETKDIGFLMDVFNHSSQAITLRYIGINQDDIIEKMSGFHL
jgi:integrase